VQLIELTADRFRNLAIEKLEFGGGVNLVLGANGAGKTSLLEAVVILGNLRSFREPGLRRAVLHGASSFRIDGLAEVGGRRRRLEVIFENTSPPRRTMAIDGVQQTVDRYLRLFPVFAITGPDRELVNGGPDERRALLDRIVFLVQPQHLEALRTYRRALRQRNAALARGASDAEIGAWESPLAASAARLIEARQQGSRALADNFSKVYGELTAEGSPAIQIDYRGDPWLEGENEAEKVEESYRERYNETRVRDRQTGFTVDGPHRHDLSLRTGGRNIRNVLSTGQTKIVAAALRLATLAEIEKERQERFPVIVDDVDAELDREALIRLIGHLGDSRQLFLSSTGQDVAVARGWRAERLWLHDGACERQEAEPDE
jgi:DNA replication and repair protein RecF